MVNYSDMMERQQRALDRVTEAEQAAANAHLWSDDVAFGGGLGWMSTGGGSYFRNTHRPYTMPQP